MDYALNSADWIFQMSIGQKPSGLLSWQDPRVFAEYAIASEGVVANGKTLIPMQPYKFNFQSKDGYGFLLASDSFNVSMDIQNGPGI